MSRMIFCYQIVESFDAQPDEMLGRLAHDGCDIKGWNANTERHLAGYPLSLMPEEIEDTGLTLLRPFPPNVVPFTPRQIRSLVLNGKLRPRLI